MPRTKYLQSSINRQLLDWEKPQRGGARIFKAAHRLSCIHQHVPRRPVFMLAGVGAVKAAHEKSVFKVGGKKRVSL